MKLRIVVGILVLVFCVAAVAADRKYIVKPRASDMKALPFSDAVLVGNTLYIAGHIGLDPKTGAPPASPEDEVRLVMDGVKATFNSVYKTYFHGDYPARAFIGINQLVRGGRYEVLGIAIKRTQ